VKRGRKGFYDEAICIGDYGTIYRMRRLRKPLPHIRRVIPAGLPIRFDGRIFIPEPGQYHPEAQVYVMPYDVVPVPCASLAEARDRIERLCRNSLFKPGTCSYTNFIAQMLVSGLRYVLAPESRFPLFVHRGNRPRLGKDYHCAIPQILFTGTWDENPPLAGDPDEVRKTLFAAARARRLFYSISNQRDDIESNGPFEQIITAPGALSSGSFEPPHAEGLVNLPLGARHPDAEVFGSAKTPSRYGSVQRIRQSNPSSGRGVFLMHCGHHGNRRV